MATKRKNSIELYGHGTCWWEEKANLDEKARRIVPAIESNDAIRCMGMISPESAEEAGEFIAMLTKDSRTLLVHTGESFKLRQGVTEEWARIAFGSADQLLRLDRIDAEHCLALEKALP